MNDGFFDIIKNEPHIRAEALVIPEMYEIWKQDKTKEKVMFTQKMAYIYHSISPVSAYSKMNRDKREEQVVADFLTRNGLQLDESLKAAAAKYRLLEVESDAANMLLEGLEAAIFKLGQFLKEAEFTDGRQGNLTSIVNAAKQATILKTTRDQLKKQIEESYQANTKTKKDVEPNIFDDDY